MQERYNVDDYWPRHVEDSRDWVVLLKEVKQLPDPNEVQGELQVPLPAAEVRPEIAAEGELVAGFRPGDRPGVRQFVREVRNGLRNNDYLVADVKAWQAYYPLNKAEYVRLFNLATNTAFLSCLHCGLLANRLHEVRNNPGDVATTTRCNDCVARYYTQCVACEGWFRSNRTGTHNHWIDVAGWGHVCGDCRRRREAEFFRCHNCAVFVRLADHGQLAGYCRTCSPPDRSKCQSRGPLEFAFPALNIEAKAIPAETIAEFTMGGGDISLQGLKVIQDEIYQRTGAKNGHYGVFVNELGTADFDASWQTRDGNFPKRLAKLLLQTREMKLNESFMVEIGNLAKQYTAAPTTHRIAFTRDINRPANEFCNQGSCWWGGSWHSRCDFKWHGGIAVRTFGNVRGKEVPISRAWMLPMKLSGTPALPKLAPSLELPADAYFLFNPYGIELLPYARLIATMTGKSYRKVSAKGTLYVNGNCGALIAEQSICDKIERVSHGNLAEDNCGCGAGGRLV